MKMRGRRLTDRTDSGMWNCKVEVKEEDKRRYVIRMK